MNIGAPPSSGTPVSVLVIGQRPLNASRTRENRPPCASRCGLGLVLAAQRGQLAQQLLLLGVQAGRRRDLDVHEQVAPAGGPQPRRARARAA